jgi:hypothetical protein
MTLAVEEGIWDLSKLSAGSAEERWRPDSLLT